MGIGYCVCSSLGLSFSQSMSLSGVCFRARTVAAAHPPLFKKLNSWVNRRGLSLTRICKSVWGELHDLESEVCCGCEVRDRFQFKLTKTNLRMPTCSNQNHCGNDHSSFSRPTEDQSNSFFFAVCNADFVAYLHVSMNNKIHSPTLFPCKLKHWCLSSFCTLEGYAHALPCMPASQCRARKGT